MGETYVGIRLGTSSKERNVKVGLQTRRWLFQAQVRLPRFWPSDRGRVLGAYPNPTMTKHR